MEDELARVLSAPIDSLIVADRRITVGAVVEQWDLPAGDRDALRHWGLPASRFLNPSYQCGVEPALTPHQTAGAEVCCTGPQQQLYALVTWGQRTVGAVASSGRVLGLLPAPITVADLPAVLRPHCPDLDIPAVAFISSTAAQFVETSWRWDASLQVLTEIQEPAFTEPEAALTRYFARVRSCLDLVLAAATLVDTAIGSGSPKSLWTETITSYPS